MTEVINPADLCRLHATAGLTCQLAVLLPLNPSRDSSDSHVVRSYEWAAGAFVRRAWLGGKGRQKCAPRPLPAATAFRVSRGAAGPHPGDDHPMFPFYSPTPRFKHPRKAAKPKKPRKMAFFEGIKGSGAPPTLPPLIQALQSFLSLVSLPNASSSFQQACPGKRKAQSSL